MPTKVKPKAEGGLYSVQVTIGEEDKNNLLTDLGFDTALQPQECQAAISVLEQDLTSHFNLMHRQMDSPLPTHVVAALDPIIQKYEELAKLLRADLLPIEVLQELDIRKIDDGSIWEVLTLTAVRGRLVIDRLKQQKSSGMHVKRAGELLADIEIALVNFFTKVRPKTDLNSEAAEEYEASKKEFLKICRKYLPAVPTARKKKSPLSTPSTKQRSKDG